MTLDPRTQLALTMVHGLAGQQEPQNQKRRHTPNEQNGLLKKQERRYMEALTKALLDPCTTVQEAEMETLLQQTLIDSPSMNGKDRTLY